MAIIRWDPFREFSRLEDKWTTWLRNLDAPVGEDRFLAHGT